MSSRTNTEKQRRRLLAAREERAREDQERRMNAWRERVKAAAAVNEERRIREAAFEAALTYSPRARCYTYTPSPRHTVLDQLRARFADALDDLLERAYEDGIGLMRKGAEVGESIRQHRLTDVAALEIQEEAFPGLSPDIYQSALGEGLFVTR